VMKINKTVEVSTYHSSHSIICCLLHNHLYKSREMQLESICVVYITCSFLLYILTFLSPYQEELYTRENKLYACIPDNFLLYVVVPDDHSD
jgi:uncharacterized membrane protein